MKTVMTLTENTFTLQVTAPADAEGKYSERDIQTLNEFYKMVSGNISHEVRDEVAPAKKKRAYVKKKRKYTRRKK